MSEAKKKGDYVRSAGIGLLILILAFSLCGCELRDEVIDSLPAYHSKVFYTEGGFQDYTDYAIYTYSETDADVLESNPYLSKIGSDVENVLSYIEDYEGWIEVHRRSDEKAELVKNYNFDKSIIDENDYVYIKTKEGEPIGDSVYGKFHNYSLYFFDMNTNTLYYFHNNI